MVGDDLYLVAHFQAAGGICLHLCHFFRQTNDGQFGMTYHIAEACDGSVAMGTLIQTHTFCPCVEQIEAFLRIGNDSCQDTQGTVFFLRNAQSHLNVVKEGVVAGMADGCSAFCNNFSECGRGAGSDQFAGEACFCQGICGSSHGIHFQFGDFYFKEVTLLATRAGGPEAGLPYAYVRWTSDQMRNHAMDLIAQGKISGKFFKPSMFKPEEIVQVYDMISKRDPRIGMQAMLKWD